AEALVTKGDLLSLRGDKVQSFELYEEALVVQAHLWGATSVRLAQERYILATSLTQVGRFAQALQEFQRAYDALVNALGKEHVKTALVELPLGQWQAAIFGSAEGRRHVVHASQLLLARTAMVDQRTIY
ncbi:tetratricopeptide repeat protein, partial [Acinetobacter baumannii]|uniref:tetratricopeptide repeat protein n=1 Tax=Acinetobacter baumannii TaxID=470 RepID=UPI001BB46B04